MCAVSGPVLRRRMAGRYPVSPGVALIISVRDFKGKDEPRLGARNDFMFLKSTFTVTGCRTFPATEKLNWSQSDFVNALKEAVTPFEEEEAFKRGPFFLCFSTHGDEKGITLSDGEYLPLNVLRAILAEQETLRSRPKVIVIQACRGAMCMTKDGPKLSSFKVTADSAADPWGNTMGIASCVQTRVSYSSDLGSIFILHFCNEILRGLLDNDGCTIQDVKEGVVRALTGIRKFNSQEIVYTTPELFCDNLQGALVLKPTNRDAVQKWRAIVTHFLSKMPWEIERNEEDIKISAFPLDEPTHEVTTAEMVDAGKFEEQSSMVSVLEEPSPCVAAGADSALDVNGFVDQLLSAARAEISNRGMEQVSLPDISEKLKQKVISIKIPGRFLAFNGWAKSLASLHRIGDAVMSTNGDKLSLDIPLSLTDLQIRYSYRIVLGKLRPGGHLTATVASNTLHLRASLPQVSDDACALVVDSFELTELGEIQVQAEGLGDLKAYLSKVLTWVTASLHDRISQAVREGLKDAIVKAGLHLNCSSLIRM